jgi:S-DNA-T family DNA segregation ATPase FtsK/SpoIIIE
LPGSPPQGGGFGGGGASGGGKPPSQPLPSARPGDPPKAQDDKPKSGFGLGGFGGKKDDSGKKDDKPSGGGGGLLGGIGAKLPGIGGGGDKKDAPKGGNPLGSLSGKLPFGKKDGDDKKADKPAGGGLLGGIGAKLPGIGGGKKDDAPPPKPGTGAPAQSPLGANKPAFGGGSAGGGSSSFGGGSSGSFGGGAPIGGGAAKAGAPAPAAKDAKAGGGFFSRFQLALPFGGKKGDKPARPKTSKAPKVQQEGLSLDTKLDILGVALTVTSLALLLSSLSPNQGAITGQVNAFLSSLFGWGALAIPVIMLGAGIWLIIRHFGDDAPTLEVQRAIGLLVLFLSVLTVMQFIEAMNYPPNASALIPQFMEASRGLGRGGGLVGGEIYLLLVSNFTEIGGFALLFIPIIVGLMLTFSLSAAELAMIVVSNYRNMRDGAKRRAIRASAERTRRLEERAAAIQAAQLAAGKPLEALPAPGTPALPSPTESPVPLPLPLGGAVAQSAEQRTIPIMQGGRTIVAPVGSEDRPAIAPQPAAASAGVATPPPAQAPAAPQERGGLGRMLPAALAGGAAAAVKALTPTEEPADNASNPAPEKRGLGGFAPRLPFGKKDESGTATPTAASSESKPGGLLGGMRLPGQRPPEEKPAQPAAALSATPAPITQTPPPPQVVTNVRPPLPAASVAAPTLPNDAAKEEPAPRLGELLGKPATSASVPAALAPQKPGEAGERPSLRPQPSGLTGTPLTSRPPLAGMPAAPPARPTVPDLDIADDEEEEDWKSLPPAQPKGTQPTPTPPASPFAPRIMQPRTEDDAKPAASGAPMSWQDRMAALGSKLPGDSKEKDDELDKPAAAAASASGTVIRAEAPADGLRQPPRIIKMDEAGKELDDEDELEDDLPPMKPVSAAPVPPAAPRPNPFSPPERPASPAFGRPDTPPATLSGGLRPAISPPPPAASPLPVQPAASVERTPVIQPQAAPAPRTGEGEAPVRRGRKEWRMPELGALLKTGSDQELDHALLLQRAKTIEETLNSFGAPGRVVEVRTGPVITQFGVEPDYLTVRGGKKVRVKVSGIAQLDKDLQLALGAKSIRIEAPVPGKGYVGIEVPNEQAAVVQLRDVMESEQFRKIKSPLAIALGQGVDGTPVAADLTSMPHLLIAGTTGSGKSVCVNSIIASMLLNNPPERLKFIMVDPKRVELTAYNGIPHLVAPVVVELERIVGVLKWVTREMDDRYRKFSGAGARNIEDYNKHLPAGEPQMPYFVIIIDELADLMMLAPEETERVITRLAALARATGIHLVIATQRPSVDVVTGLIKANFPARIAFAVAGSVDSRVILDQPGAERLLGRGDMLYMSGDSPAPQRLQGVYVSDTEINNITRYWRQQMDDSDLAAQGRPLLSDFKLDEMLAKDAGDRRGTSAAAGIGGQQARQQGFWDRAAGGGASSFVSSNENEEDGDNDDMDEDDLYDQAVAMVRSLKKASVSLLQRRLRIGYTRAAKLIDLMEERGVVGPAQSGSTPRDVIG